MIKKVVILLLVSSKVICEESEKYDNPFENLIVHNDYGLDIYKFLRRYNYPVETHWVQTEDGYVLRMQHISRRNATFFERTNKPAILLMHGLLSSAMDFVNMGPNKSLALVLADAGFDVWLGNNRGTTWSRQHVTLNPDIDQKFWDYSFETCGYYDLPAKIDYIIEKSGQEKIFYVGHSQGTSQFFAMAALRPEYNNKIALMSALAPVVYMTHISSPIPRLMAKYMDVFELVANLLKWHELLRHSWVISEMSKLFCSDNSPFQELCAAFVFTLTGYNSPQLDRGQAEILQFVFGQRDELKSKFSTFNPLQKGGFWGFETCGYYDLPAKIDYIIEKSGQEKIFYVGHSQGTSQFFAMAALRPEYNNKIALMSALAPVVYMTHISSPIPRLMAKYMDVFELVANLLKWHELLRHSWVISEMSKLFCSDNSPFQELCAAFVFTLTGYNSPQLDRSLIPVLASNAPAGISLKMLVHYGQEIRSGHFRRYDFGTLLNIKYYRSTTPPLFNISAITAPVALYYSQNDFFAAVQDVERFAKELPNIVKKRLIEYKRFTHLDFIFAKNTNELINLDLLAHLEDFMNNGTTTPSPQENKGNFNFVKKSVITIIIVTLWYISY